MAPEICTKMLKKLSEKFPANCTATAPGYSMEKIEEKEKKERQKKKKWKIEKPKDVGHFLV